MARKTPDVTDDDFTERIVDVDVSSEMESSFLEYAYSVIYARALPDARDGLKPVQRRILFAMDEMNLRPDRSHVKCARVVGQVMGLYHPHGDSAIYDALVRLAQEWTMRLPLIDGHGNFGSPDAGPAAMRYTECRMDHPALAMTDELDQDTVDFKPNYDGKESEPVVLPAAFPNLLVNGTTGIAVGMATNIAPHNLGEVVQALRHLLKHPNAGLETLMRFIPGPDLPTGGRIVGLSGVADAYATGKGSFKIRATARIEKVTPRRQGIVVTELPYLVGTEKVIEQIKKLVQTKKLTGIADVKDLADLTSGTRLVIEIKNGFNPEAVLEQLYRLTKLEDSFSINSVALVDGQPRTMSLHDMLTVFLEHRLEVTLRRTTFNRNKAADRLHLVEGLLIAILDIDDVIAIIRGSEDAATARAKLMEVFELTEVQANYILDMQLRRLTKYSRIELESERDDLRVRIAELNEIIDNDDKLRGVVNDELAEVAKRFGTPRRTVLLESSGQSAAASAPGPLEIADAPCWLLLSTTGLVARVDTESPLPDRGPRAKHDVLQSVIRGTARGDFGVITSAGRVIRMNALDLPTVPLTANAPNLAGGSRIGDLIDLERGEQVLCLASLDPESPGLAIGTARGVVKVVKADILNKDSWEVITFKDPKDRLVGAVELTDEEGQDLVFITSDAQLLRFSTDLVNPQGRAGSGVAGIKLATGAEVIFFGAAGVSSGEVVTMTAAGEALPGTETPTVKVTPLSAYPAKGRATAGVRCHRFLKGIDRLQLGWAGRGPAIAASATGTPVELPAADPRRDGSGTPAKKSIGTIGTA
ncbi:DNA gyrase/topoisomerase IV subunit A [Granulicoccus sp. GXG6511]|uniref:DNA gyrase/topoisomerase IV subunit A n=1 Tax=Granulicoccus sp. GXG6511 TaxID=3381351 RepID=UPI003D7CEA64